MANNTIRPIGIEDKEWIRQLMRERWAAGFFIVHHEEYRPAKLPGFISGTEPTQAGLITYRIDAQECEIVPLDSLFPGQGIGGALFEAVQHSARRAGCRRLYVVTTNNNLHTLRVYQRKGFVLAALRSNAIEESRKRKPIPLLGEDGIPIRDEIELELMLDRKESSA